MGAMFDDIKPYGDALIYASLVSGAGLAVWKMWFKPIVTWVKEQGDTNTSVARVVSIELPKITRAIERVSDTQRDHGKKIEDLDHRVTSIEGGAHIAPDTDALMNHPTRRGRRVAE